MTMDKKTKKVLTPEMEDNKQKEKELKKPKKVLTPEMEAKKQKEKELKEAKKQLISKNINELRIMNPYKEIVVDNNLESFGNNDIFTNPFDATKVDYSLEEYIKLVQKIIFKLDIIMTSILISKNSPNEILIDHLVVIKDNPGIKYTKLYYTGSKNYNNLSQDDYKTLDYNSMILFQWPDRIPTTESTKAEVYFKVLLNVYSILIYHLNKTLESNKTNTEDIYKELIGAKCGVFKQFTDFFNGSKMSGSSEVNILYKKQTKKTLNTGNKPKSNKKKEVIQPVVSDNKEFISSVENSNINTKIDLPDPNNLDLNY